MTAAQLRAATILVPAPTVVEVRIGSRFLPIKDFTTIMPGKLILVVDEPPLPTSERPGITISPVSGSGF